jgi:hypothetical protein
MKTKLQLSSRLPCIRSCPEHWERTGSSGTDGLTKQSFSGGPDLFDLVQQPKRTNERPKFAALIEVLKALKVHPRCLGTHLSTQLLKALANGRISRKTSICNVGTRPSARLWGGFGVKYPDWYPRTGVANQTRLVFPIG